MKDEIKEILDEFESLFEVSEAPEHIINGFNKIKYCITNLQEELEGYKQERERLLNKLDYVKKNKELQQEVNKLTAESTEWESKCYDLQEENERLNNVINELEKYLLEHSQINYDNSDIIIHEQLSLSVVYEYLKSLKEGK